MQGKTEEEVAGEGSSDLDVAAIRCLIELYHALRSLLHEQHFREAELLVSALASMLPKLPRGARSCVSSWPCQLALDGSLNLHVADAALGMALLDLLLRTPSVNPEASNKEDSVTAHLLHACITHTEAPGGPQVCVQLISCFKIQ